MARLRVRTNLSQSLLAQKLTELNPEVLYSQSLIAKYELGAIADPNPLILRTLAKLYGLEWKVFINRLVLEKYGLSDITEIKDMYLTEEIEYLTACRANLK